jgi:endonuclease/exonuclease/phosphatase (EEP) superfamily protein YafD
MDWRPAARKAAGAGILAAALVPPITGGWLGFDTFYPFQAFLLHVAAAALLCGLVAHLAGSRPLVMLSLAASLFNIAPTLPLPPESAAEESGISVFTANAWFRNPTPEQLVEAIRASGADIVALQEVTDRFTPLLDGLRDVYPHQASGKVHGVGATMLLSQHPLDLRPAIGEDLSSFVHARVSLPSGPVEVVAVHLVVPFAPEHFTDSARLAARLAAIGADTPVVVAGDFNATPWMAGLARLREAARLSHAEGLRPTFPAGLGWLALPIDHILVRGFTPAGAQRLSGTGSDHAAVLARLVPNAALRP